MARYAHVENNLIVGYYDYPPQSWNNISNFHILSDEEMSQYGFKKIIKDDVTWDNTTQRPLDPKYTIDENGDVIEKITIVDIMDSLSDASFWAEIRIRREQLLNDVMWRYERYAREVRLGLGKPTDDINMLDAYVQALADITKQENPRSIQWPVLA